MVTLESSSQSNKAFCKHKKLLQDQKASHVRDSHPQQKHQSLLLPPLLFAAPMLLLEDYEFPDYASGESRLRNKTWQ